MKKYMYLILLLSALPLAMAAQCSASFTWNQPQNNVIAFTNTSTPITSNSYFVWDFGDNLPTQYGVSPTHTFAAPGSYLVCVTMMDTINSCQQVFCDSVTVTGTLTCNLAIQNMFIGNETCTGCSDGSVILSLYGGTAPFSFQWSNGSTTQNISGLTPGTYSVCITDANGCVVCDSAVVNSMALCTVSISGMSVTPESCVGCNDGSIVPTVTAGMPPYSYAWSNGATTASIGNLSAGYYSLCVTDANNCVVCDTVIVQSSTANNCQAAFTVTQLSTTLYQFTSTSTASQFANSYWNFGDGQYLYYTDTASHSYVLSGSYVVCLTVFDSVYNCISTVCDTLTNVVGTGGPAACSANFYVVYDSLQNNQFAWIVNNSTVSPTAVQIWSWGDNTYDTLAYPTHVYSQTGTYTICLYIVDTANNCSDTLCQTINVVRLTQQAASLPFTVSVVASLPTSINTVEAEQWSVYPVPSSTVLSIKSTELLVGRAYRIIDVSGRMVETGVLSSAQIAIDNLGQGMYFLQLMNNTGNYSIQRFIKQ